MIVVVISIIGWGVVLAVSLINSTRGEAKDSLKELNENISELADNAINFLSSVSLESNEGQRKNKSRVWRAKSERMCALIKRQRLELNSIYGVSLADDNNFYEFLEVAGNDQQDFSDEAVGESIGDLTTLAESLCKSHRTAFYKKYPVLNLGLSSKQLLNVLLIFIVLTPLFLFIYFQLSIANRYIGN